MKHRCEEPTDDEERNIPHSLRGLLARITRNTTPPPRKAPDQRGRREVRGD